MRFDQITDIAPAEVLSKQLGGLGLHTFGPKKYKKKTAAPTDRIPDTGHRSKMLYAVLVCWRDGKGREIESPIVKWSGQGRARALTFWLRERLGVPMVPVAP